MNFIKKNRLVILILASFLHTIFLLFLTYWLLERNYIYGDEKFLIKWSSVVKKKVLGIDKKPSVNDYFFINTAYDNMLIEKFDEKGRPENNQAITDRKKLTRLFEILNKFPDSYKYIVCDIFFKDKSPYDSSLYVQLKKVKNIIISYHLNKKGVIEDPIFDINRGITDYYVVSSSFLKYPLMRRDTLPSLALKMYQDLTNSTFKRRNLFSFMNNRMSFNNVIVDFKIRYIDIYGDRTENKYPCMTLGNVIRLPDSVFADTIRNKYILIGDLKERDNHETIIGSIPGILIPINTFLALESGENIIKPFFILILFVGYFLISLDVLSSRSFTERKITQQLSAKKFGKFLIKFLGYVFYLGFLSVLIYFLYNIHINILIFAVYLKFLDTVLKHYRTEPEIKERKGISKVFSNIRLKIYNLLTSK